MEPGKNTSEFGLTKLIVYAGFAVTLAGAVLQVLQDKGVLEGVAWVPTVVMAVGMLSAVLKGLGYTVGRNTLKAADLASKGAVEVATLLPLLKEAVALAKEARQPPLVATEETPAPLPVLPQPPTP